jgi:acid phosphatase family membrane protein YuiD
VRLLEVLDNRALIGGLLAWALAQGVKLPIHYVRARKWDWSLLFLAGGMPSSHSALVTAVAHGIGLSMGFNSGAFALAVALAMIVIYDATGIRRQAGLHAEMLNELFKGLLEGHPLRGEQLLEVLGHSPAEALAGMLLGLAISQGIYMIWPP